MRARLAYRAGRRPEPADLDASRYLFESTRVRNKRELASWTQSSFPARAPLLAGVRALMQRIHSELTFRSQGDDRLDARDGGVRATPRSLPGLRAPDAVVSSLDRPERALCERLVLTRPPPGRERLVGADASHAWVSVYCPDFGWIDADPNGLFPSLEHVTLGWGRDYDDVIPLRGVLLGGGEHTLDIEVTVAPKADHESLFPASAR